MAKERNSIIPVERIQQCIYLIRGYKVMLDSDLAGLLGLTTKHLNWHAKRNFLDNSGTDFRFRMTMKEFRYFKTLINKRATWGGRRYLPYVYTFQGICLLINRLRLNLSDDVKSQLLMLFEKREMLVFDLGFNRPEERFKERLSKILDGIATTEKHYGVVFPSCTYYVDIYLPDYKIAIEIDESHHRYNRLDDTVRQQKIE